MEYPSQITGLIMFLCLLAWAGPSMAWTTFDTTCTLPSEPVNFVSSPDTRGTMDIIWSSLIILATCTWSIQHLDVPYYDEQREKKSWKSQLEERWAASTLLRWHFLPSFHPRYIVGEERWHKLNWMLFTLFAPEYILGKALSESSAAHHSAADMQSLSTKRGIEVEWSATHAYLANMRGMILRFQVAAVPTSLEPVPGIAADRGRHRLRKDIDPPYEEQDAYEAEKTELKQCIEICGVPCKNRPESTSNEPGQNVRRAWVLSDEDERAVRGYDTASPHYPTESVQHDGAADVESGVHPPNIENEKRRVSAGGYAAKVPRVLGPHKTWTATWALTSAQWFYAYSTGIIKEPHGVSFEAIKDKSKSDTLVKLIAVSQITWLTIQIIARGTQSLAVTLLEITVLSFAACAIVTYLFILQKPKDVNLPFVIDIPRILTRQQIIGLAARAHPSTIITRQFWLHGVAIRSMADNVFPPSPYVKFVLPFPWLELKPISIHINAMIAGIGVGGAIFGSIHTTAWDFAFPSEVERIFWRVSSLVLIALVVVSTLIYWLSQHILRTDGRDDTKTALLLKYIGYALLPLYLVARIFLLIEIWRALAYPAKSTFEEVNWSAMLPHGG